MSRKIRGPDCRLSRRNRWPRHAAPASAGRPRRRSRSPPAQPGRPPRTLKYGDTFVVLDSRGDIGATSGESAGLFHQDTRHLSRLELLVNGAPPLLLGSNLRDDNSAFFVDLTNPDLIAGQRIVLEKDSVHILRTMFLWRGTAYQRLGVRNYGDRPIDLRSAILFENDFADLFEVRGAHRERRGTATAAAARQRPRGPAELSRPRRQDAAHDADLRSAAGRSRRQAPLFTICISPPARRGRFFLP